MTRRRRAKHGSWLIEEVDRARLKRMDDDPSIPTLSLGELPGWMRKRWARKKMTGKHAWANASALPTLYARSGHRLPVEATVATLRILTHTHATGEHADVALLRDYLHPVAAARVVDALIVRWVYATNDALDVLDPEVSHDFKLQPDYKLATQWAPQSHRVFHDRHTVEHVVSLVVHGITFSDDGSRPIWQRIMYPRERETLLRTLRHAGDFGAATLAILCRAEKNIGTTAREAAGAVNPFKREHRYHTWNLEASYDEYIEAMTFPEQLDAIAALGFASGSRAVTTEDGERRWVGIDLFEALIDDAEHPVTTDLPADAIRTALMLLRILFAQTSARLEIHRKNQEGWPAHVWRELFLEHPYMSFWSRRVLWSLTDGRTFRVCEDLTLADSSDDAFTLPDGARVHVTDAQTISTPELSRWAELFTDYEIVNPTEQFS